jgi:hypothetical protein
MNQYGAQVLQYILHFNDMHGSLKKPFMDSNKLHGPGIIF